MRLSCSCVNILHKNPDYESKSLNYNLIVFRRFKKGSCPQIQYIWFSRSCVCTLLPSNGQCGKHKVPYLPPYTQLGHMTFGKTAEMRASLRLTELYIFLETSALTYNSKCIWTGPFKITELIKNYSPILLLNLFVETRKYTISQ